MGKLHKGEINSSHPNSFGRGLMESDLHMDNSQRTIDVNVLKHIYEETNYQISQIFNRLDLIIERQFRLIFFTYAGIAILLGLYYYTQSGENVSRKIVFGFYWNLLVICAIILLIFESFLIFIYSLISIYIWKPTPSGSMPEIRIEDIKKGEETYRLELLKNKMNYLKKLKRILEVKELLFKNGLYLAYSMFFNAIFLIISAIYLKLQVDYLLEQEIYYYDFDPILSHFIYVATISIVSILFWINTPLYRFLIKQTFLDINLKFIESKKLSFLLGRQEDIPQYPV